MNKNYYQIFGLPLNCTDEEIKKTYRKLALKFHPDKNPGDRYFEERFKELQEAYETLSNPVRRRNYDAKFKQTETTNASFNYRTETKQESKPSIKSLANSIEALYVQVGKLKLKNVNLNKINVLLDEAFNEELMQCLIVSNDIESKHRIIHSTLGLYKFLSKGRIQKYSKQLVRLAYPDNELIVRIYEEEKSALRKIILKEQRGNLLGAAKWIGIAGVFIWIFFFTSDTPPTSASPTVGSTTVIDSEPEIRHRVSRYRNNQLKTGDSPYNDYFGEPVYDKNYKNQLEIKNGQDLDVVVCLVDYSSPVTGIRNEKVYRTIRNEYIRAGESFVMTSIPNGTYYLKSFQGKYWNPDTIMFNGKIKGSFDTLSTFSVSDDADDLIRMKQNDKEYSIYTITLYPVSNGNMESRPLTLDGFFGGK